MSNEVYVGSGTQATMIPESNIVLGTACTYSGKVISTIDSTIKLVPNLYVGCEVKLVEGSDSEYHTIIENDATSITVDSSIGSALATGSITATIQKFGAPAPTSQFVRASANRHALLSDNWLGLVNEFTPPNVEVEMKQLNLAVSGTRNFAHQYKGAETVSGGSLDISMNNGSWLYYALGKIDTVTHDATATSMTSDSTVVTVGDNSTKFFRVIGGNEYPPSAHGNSTLKNIDTTKTIAYTFKELNGQDLPSFALDVSYNKASNTNRLVVDDGGASMYSRIFTGCQVNTMTLNFEESQELKTSLELVTRRAFDAPTDYVPHRAEEGATGLFNYDASTTTPYMYSDGSITLFGQTYARVKSGSLTINNNFTQQRFIGNTNRQIMNAHIPAQRTYELSLTLLITDTAIWKELREQEEYNTDTGKIKLRFEKSADDFIEIELDDYIIQSVNVPFPSDKGPIEVEATISARSLSDCKYTGKWVIINDD
tara:strand:- start:13078 stop:14529 length:1452 start_codon:yes stop_codon:yes gene_type:complete